MHEKYGTISNQSKVNMAALFEMTLEVTNPAEVRAEENTHVNIT